MRRAPLIIQWTLATAVAVVAAERTVAIFSAAVPGFLVVMALPIVAGALFGAAVGVAQWLVLRRRIANAAMWIAATIIGFALAWVMGFVFAGLTDSVDHRWPLFASFAAATPLLSLGQARLLRRHTSRAPLWIVASVVGWVAFLLALEIDPRAGPAGGLLAGAITGVALSLLLDHPAKRVPAN